MSGTEGFIDGGVYPVFSKNEKWGNHQGLASEIYVAESSELSLEFTDHIAKLASEEKKVVVSGFAKGVDLKALDSIIQYHGKSIIVLPQGILTFQSGFKKYYEPIVNGDVLVLSTFFPKGK